MADRSLGLAVAGLLGLGAPVLAEEKPPAPTVSVIGEARAELRPDIAVVGFEIVDDRPTPVDASNENARLVGAVVDGLKGSGIAAQDISTVGASLSPVLSEQRDPKTNALIRSVVTGYHARNALRVKLREIERVGAIIGTSVQNGALYDGVDFELSDREARLDVLRMQAAANAVHRAQLYAEGAGMKIGPLRSMNAAGAEPPREFAPKSRAFAPMAAAAAAVPIEPGIVELGTSVEATFELATP